MLDFTRYMDGTYRACNGAATFIIEKCGDDWHLTVSRVDGTKININRKYLREAKLAARHIACWAGWHKV